MKTKYKYLLLSTALISHNAQAWFGSSWGSDIESAVSSAATSVVSTVTNVASDVINVASTVGSDVESAASDVATFVVQCWYY